MVTMVSTGIPSGVTPSEREGGREREVGGEREGRGRRKGGREGGRGRGEMKEKEGGGKKRGEGEGRREGEEGRRDACFTSTASFTIFYTNSCSTLSFVNIHFC